MNNHSKRLCRHLESLGFQRDYDAEQRTSADRVYVHANEPDTQVKVQPCMAEYTIQTQVKNANRIAGLATSDSDGPTVKERVKAERRHSKTQAQRAMQARMMRAQKADEEYEIQQQRMAREREVRSIEDLMRPGFGR